MGVVGATSRFGTVLASALYHGRIMSAGVPRSSAREGNAQPIFLMGRCHRSLPDHTQIFQAITCGSVKYRFLVVNVTQAGKSAPLAVSWIHPWLDSCSATRTDVAGIRDSRTFVAEQWFEDGTNIFAFVGHRYTIECK